MENIFIPPSAAGERLSVWLAKNRYALPADCAGRGKCGKCRVNVIRGEFLRHDRQGAEAYPPDSRGQVLACRAVIPAGGAEVSLPETEGGGLVGHSAGKPASKNKGERPRGCGVALDIGTTTLAASLVDRASGEVIDTYSCLNPQRSYGADVISRIMACRDGHLFELCRLIREKTAEILNIFVASHPDQRPGLLVAAGNTTMLHLFSGVSPEGIGVFPFTPAFTGRRDFSGEELGLPVGRVTLLPSAAAYIGGDITGGVFACGLAGLDSPSALIDIGTNGEMVLSTGASRGGRLIAASAAAGPALEGANISCGVGGIPGAVSHVAPGPAGMPGPEGAPGGLTYRTIGDRPPVGICGCGLIDLVAALLDTGVIDETGYMEDGDYHLCGVPGATARHLGGKEGEPLPEELCAAPVILTQRDVREFQLAKSAIFAGFSSLLDHAGISLGELERIYIAGGLGYYMNVGSAVRTGILPPVPPEKFGIVGNTSLAGAEACLVDTGAIEKIAEIAGRCEILDLNSLPLFSDLFMRNMIFPEE